MRIALVINTFSPNGATLVVCNLAKGLAERGHDVLLLPLRRPDSPEAAYVHLPLIESCPRISVGTAVEGSLRSLTGLIRAGLAMRRTLGAFRPDVVHSHTEIADLIVACFMRRDAVAVRTAHVDHYLYILGKLGTMVERLLNAIGGFDRVVAISERTFEHNSASSHTILVHNCIFDLQDLPARRPDPGAGSRLRASIVGTLIHRKGQRDFVKKMLDYSKSGKALPFDLVLYGEGPDMAQLKTMAVPLGTAVQVAGYEYDRDRIYEKLSVLLVVSKNEGLSTVMLEAVARGVPVVSFPVAGAADVLGRQEVGRIVSDFEQLIRTLEAQDLPTVSEAARQETMHEFSISSAAAKHEELYQRATQERIKWKRPRSAPSSI